MSVQYGRQPYGSSWYLPALLVCSQGSLQLLAGETVCDADAIAAEEVGSVRDEPIADPAARDAVHRSMQTARFNLTEAHAHLETALQHLPDNAKIWMLKATNLQRMGRLPEALRAFRLVFQSRTAPGRDLGFLQGYVAALHRMDAQAELREVWPQIAAAAARSGAKWPSPLHCPRMVNDALLDGAEPFPDPSGLEIARLLKRHSDEIRAEFDRFHKRPDSGSSWSVQEDQDLVAEPHQWTQIALFRGGRWDHHWCGIFATVCRILRGRRDVEGIVDDRRAGMVNLLKLEAGAWITPHFGSFNWRLIAQLGLLVPDGVVYSAGNETRNIAEGDVLILDDTFLHSVLHQGVGPRVCLAVHFFHPTTKPLTWDEWQAS